ncbi:uncharacterized protein LOC127416930 [Myxocyprinus asiaticus]|uniref:uncharacterized protein LOC127416930 n=1 Tax=Myxocyprinus asiaticus TaxID=70543 RepID=UPI0022229662|nr:uncharacterized protein LOC127416930 [Myxocyprinus asiaticus]
MSDSEEEMAGEDICCLLPSEEDSSDEELRYITDSEEKKSTSSSPCPTTNPSAELHFTFPSCSKSEHEHTELGLFTEASQALCSVSQRQHIHLGHDQGLEGFLTLGLKPEPLKSSLTLAQTPREGQNHREFSLAVGEQFWRPSSSLYHHADEELVTAMVHSRPIRSTPPAVTPCYGTMSSQRLCFSSTLSRSPPSPSRVPSAGSYRPRSFCRPLSYAAQEISEIQTVEQPEPVNIDEDEEDCLALACLEEEFRNMSITPFDQGED